MKDLTPPSWRIARFIDLRGKRLHIVDPNTSEEMAVGLFVASLGELLHLRRGKTPVR